MRRSDNPPAMSGRRAALPRPARGGEAPGEGLTGFSALPHTTRRGNLIWRNVISGIGAAPKRREDIRFLTGQGRYLDDLAFENVAHAVVLRSPHAHARIERIERTRRGRFPACSRC